MKGLKRGRDTDAEEKSERSDDMSVDGVEENLDNDRAKRLRADL